MPSPFFAALFLPLLVFSVMFTPALTAGTAKEDAWKLIWQDEFSGTQLNLKNWSLCERGKADWKNTMSDDPRCLSVADGVLHLKGIVKDGKEGPSPYLTAGVHSQGKFSYLYGKVQIKARFKSAQGAWPALWMLGSEGGWPTNGEIDLMEHLNFDRKIYQTVHSQYTLRVDQTNTPKKGGTAPIKRDDWNTYGAEWSADEIVFTVNGKVSHRYPRMPEKGALQYPFKQPFYLLLSMQIGGSWVGQAKAEDYPAGMEIDWVRVYQKKLKKPKNPRR